MATQDITADQFSDIINGDDIVLVDFWASWCRPCLSFAPTFVAASEQHPQVLFAKIDTEAQHELAAGAQIWSIPTLMALKKGKLVFNQTGALPPPALEQFIEQIKLFDVDTATAARTPSDSA